jgi:hypothetical protein
MNLNRSQIDKLTTSLAVTLLTIMIFVVTLAAANSIFRWDLFPPEVEKAGSLFMVASFITIISSVIINIMINIGRIADKINGK